MSDIAPQAALPNPAELTALVELILAEAKTHDSTAAEAAVSFSSALSVTVRLGEVETLEHHRNRGLGVTVYYGQRKGSASTSDWQPDAVRATVRAACEIARYTEEDPYAGLADPERLATDIPDLDLDHPWPLSVPEAIELARTCEDSARACDARIRNSEGASVASGRHVMLYGNSHGFIGGYPSSRHSLSCSVLAQNDSGMQRDHWYTMARDPADLQDAVSIGRQAAERALRRLDGRRVKTQKAPVLFVPEMARGLIGHFLGAIRGGALYRKATFLLDKLGQPVFADLLHIREEPHLRKALGSAPFDAEGVRTEARNLVSGGILQGYLLDSYSARRLGMQTTGNAGGTHNLIITPGADDFAALLQRLDTGLVVTSLMGQGINAVTGDYSRGAAGFWVEGGEIQYPVEEITIAGNLQQMFMDIVAVGSDVDARGSIHCGSLLVAEMMIAGA